MKKNFFLTLFVLFLGTWACVHEPFPAADNGLPNPPPDVDTCNPQTIYFKQDILPILESSCASSGCHDEVSAQNGVVLTNYNSIINTADVRPGQPQNSDLFDAITETDPDKRMPPPPASALSTEQIDRIRRWIEQGALNNSCEKACDTASVGFAAHISPLINNYCRSCHSGANPPKGLKLESYAQIEAIALDGRLMGVLKGQQYAQMPPAGPLNTCQLRQFELWVLAGAPQN